jgi:hypothetical protein
MDIPPTDWLSYRQVLAWSLDHPLRLSEIPVEHAISTPLPTLRYGIPAYIQMAAPAVRAPGQPTRQGEPDRWWLFAAQGGRLLAYALITIVPAGDGLSGPESDATPPIDSVSKLREVLDTFSTAMESAVGSFFAGHPALNGAQLLQLFEAMTPAALVAQYRVLAPDFFAWLDA